MVSKADPIIIVGGGAFGLSTALHLSQRGYFNVTVFEQDSAIPSAYSAANDINKILRAEYEDPFYTELAINALQAWKTPLFAPHFHQTGFLHCVSGAAPARALDTLNRFRAAAESHADISKYVTPIGGADDIQQASWQLDGPLPGWHGYLNRYDGYAHSGDALRAVHRVVQGQGVRFFLGAAGTVTEIVYADAGAGAGRRARGIRTADGRFHAAALVIVAVGAAATRLVPDIGAQVVAKSWSVAHLQLTAEETSALRGLPVTYARDLGFFFEPDPVTRLLKLCPMGGGYVHTDAATGLSQPPRSLPESAFLPRDDEAKLRTLLRQTLPALADRPFVQTSLCWFADTADSDFIVDYVPGSDRSLVLLSGDSGHGFKMFPLVGQWIADLLASPVGQTEARWKWKTPQPDPQPGDAAWGNAVSWRLGETKELADIRPYPAKL